MQNEVEIDALLTSGDTGSIIDGLMAVPRKSDNARRSTEWDRAVANRFETRLVRQMRSQIDGGNRRPNAA